MSLFTSPISNKRNTLCSFFIAVERVSGNECDKSFQHPDHLALCSLGTHINIQTRKIIQFHSSNFWPSSAFSRSRSPKMCYCPTILPILSWMVEGRMQWVGTDAAYTVRFTPLNGIALLLLDKQEICMLRKVDGFLLCRDEGYRIKPTRASNRATLKY